MWKNNVTRTRPSVLNLSLYVFPGTSAQTQPLPRRDLRAHVSMLEARSELKAHFQTTLPFPETQSHHVLVRDRQATAQRFTDLTTITS